MHQRSAANLLAFGFVFCLAFFLSCRCQHNLDSQNSLSTSTSTVNPATATRRALATAAAKGFSLDRARAYRDLAKFTEAPHPMGSPRQEALALYIEESLTESQLVVNGQAFTATLPVRDPEAASSLTFELPGKNIVAHSNTRTKPCTVLLGSHYDTKDLEGQKFVGANDSASSSIALMQIMPYLAKTLATSRSCDVTAVWFDGEESYLLNWDDGQRHPARRQDNTYGSRYFSEHLPTKVIALILLDMIGSEPLAFSQDSNSSHELRELLKIALEDLDLSKSLALDEETIEDDHSPFLEKGIPALDLINFENLDHWHQGSDITEHISLESIEQSSRVAIYLAVYLSADSG